MQKSGNWLFDGKEIQTKEGTFVKWYDHQFFLLMHNGKKFHGEIIKNDSENNHLTIKINQRIFEVKRKGELDELITSLGLDKQKVKKLKELQAPMPGRVLKIFVKKGDEIQIGENVLSLEAMKMENMIKSPGDAVIKNILVKTGQAVEKNQILIELE